jgi:endo-1,4-beta-xylanase
VHIRPAVRTGRSDTHPLKIYGDIVRACTKEKGFTGVTFWGYSDKYSWRNRPNAKAYPLLFDEDMKPKPAFFAVREAFD